jgi:hypothetical protein
MALSAIRARSVLPALRRRLPPPPVLLGRLLVAHVLLKLLVYPMVMAAEPFGDEQAYLNGGMALSNALRDLFAFTAPDVAELDRNLVASGWFMPGMSVVVTPLYLVLPDAGPAAVRAWLGLVSLGVFVVVVRLVERQLGAGWACVVAAFPGLVPSWVFLSYGVYGDLLAGLVLLGLVMVLVRLYRGLRAGRPPTLRDGLVVGLLSIVLLYLRSSTSILLLGLGVVTLVVAVVMLAGRDRWRAVAAAALAGVVFLLLLAPWSLYASHVLGGRVVTTTTVPTVMAVTFGDEREICFGECDPDSTLWFRPLRYAREVGQATGTSEVEVLKVMSDHALRDLTVDHYLGRVAYNLASYSLQPATFVDHLAPDEGRSLPGKVAAWGAKLVSWAMYFPVLLVAAASLLTAVRRSLEARLLDVLVKLCTGALLAQPFVHLGGGRYWTTAGPFFALGAATFLREREIAGGGTAPPDGVVTDRDRTAVRWFGRVQETLRALTAVAAAVLLVVIVVWGVRSAL